MLDSRVKDAIQPVTYAVPMETMGERIRKRREGQGLTQAQLAKLVGVTKGAVSQWELGGTKNIKLVIFLKLVEVLHTSADYLVSGATPGATGGRYRAFRSPES